MKIRGASIVGVLIVLMSAGFSFVLLRALAASAANKTTTAVDVIAGSSAETYNAARADPTTGELGFHATKHGTGVPSADYVVSLVGIAHLLRPHLHTPRQLVLYVRRGPGMQNRSMTKIYINDRFVGQAELDPSEDNVAKSVDLDEALSPPADAWRLRLVNPHGGMIVTSIVLVIGKPG